MGGSADAYRQSSSASPRGVVTGGGYCGSSASTPHSHSTNGSYSVANPYTGSPTLYTSRKYTFLFFLFPSSTEESTMSLHFPILSSRILFDSSSALRKVSSSNFIMYKKEKKKENNRSLLTISTLLLLFLFFLFFFSRKKREGRRLSALYFIGKLHAARNHRGRIRLLQFNGTVNRVYACIYDFSLCEIFVLAHEQYGIFYTSGDGSAFAPVVRPPTTSVPPHWSTQHHLATAAQ